MNLILKAVFFCHTSQQRWGKGLTIAEAKKNAGLTKSDKKAQYFVKAACFMNPSDEQLKELEKCITADPINGNAQYYTENRTAEDSELIQHYHVGWLTVETNVV